MRGTSVISILGLLLVSSRLLTQQQTATGAIEGIVVRSETSEPIQGVQVTLTRSNITPAAVPEAAGQTFVDARGRATAGTVTTRDDGKFSFRNLNAGEYLLVATQNGFVRTEYAQRNPYGSGRPIFLTAGQSFKDAILRITPTATVTGRVLDENGRPATGAPVQLVRVIYNPGKNYQSPVQGVADDHGEYRLSGVTPGRYYLVAGNPPGPLRPASATQRFSLVYYPSGSSLEQASMIELKPGGEVSFDFRVQRIRSGYRVKGRIADATGSGLPANTEIMLGYQSPLSRGSFSNGRNFDPATGAFELQNVPPGDYALQVQIPGEPLSVPQGQPLLLMMRQVEQASRPRAITPIQVVDKDLDGVVLTVTRGATVNGRLIVEGQPLSVVPNFQQMTLSLVPADGSTPTGFPPASTPASEDGRFQVVGLRQGEYRVSLRATLPPTSGLYIKSIRYAGDDVLTKPLKFSGSGSGEFEVTLGRGPGQLAGNVTDIQ
jgi:hypothetical protein